MAWRNLPNKKFKSGIDEKKFIWGKILYDILATEDEDQILTALNRGINIKMKRGIPFDISFVNETASLAGHLLKNNIILGKCYKNTIQTFEEKILFEAENPKSSFGNLKPKKSLQKVDKWLNWYLSEK